MDRERILYLTDLSYPAKGRNYSEEDIYITDRLKEHFDITLCHPGCAQAFEDYVDIIVFRNIGSVIGFQDIYRDFVKRVHEKGLNTFNSFDGKADMRGKQYLTELTREGYPVIPTVESTEHIGLLLPADHYVIKPKDGADSIGMEFLTKDELLSRRIINGTMLIQPAVDFLYELSFYFINDLIAAITKKLPSALS